MGLVPVDFRAYSQGMEILDEYDTWLLAIGRTAATRETTRKVLRRFLAVSGCEPGELTRDHVVRFLANDALSTNTRSAYYWHIAGFSDWMVSTDRLNSSAVSGIPRPKSMKRPPRPVPAASLPKILECAESGRVRMMIMLAAFQGLRVHEIAKLHGRDIDTYARSLEVEGKGGKVALLPLHDDVHSAIEVEGMPANDYWFVSRKRPGKPLVASTVSKLILAAMRGAGVNGTPHALRHFFGTELVRSGANLRVVQELMRHSNLTTTQGYIEVQGAEMRAALGNLRIVA